MKTKKDGYLIISEAEIAEGTLTVMKENENSQTYSVYKNLEQVQPEHDAESTIRYLTHVIHSLSHQLGKKNGIS